ncbi:sensor histidine kinase [Kitasatospora sp. NPDC049258]|uniref:sensor histidine kinase n=1 Tax=Kitasatospora sp. NPDC049258 TaxID=3155394 RepID=UPI00342A41F4
MRIAFLLLLTASLTRYLSHHWSAGRTPWVVGLGLALAAGHLLLPTRRPPGPRRPRRPRRPGRPGRPGRPAGQGRRPAELAGLGAVLGSWAVLVLTAPSFAWCAIPLIYTVLRALPARAAIPVVAAMTALVVAAELRLADGFDPTLPLLPPTVAALATAVFLYMERQAARQRALIDDLISTRRELAATERREGALAERERLAMEIHDTLAQGLSSQQMLLQAADRTWEQDLATARGHVRTATAITGRNLAEARRFVHDLAPAELADGGTLDSALRALAERESAESGRPVRCHIDGAPVPLPAAAQAALLRIAQGALANVREHAGARTAALTLSYLGEQAVLDIADDGRGFAVDGGTAGSQPDGGTGRGHGLPAMRARLRQLGGALTVESAPGEGTVVSASIPLAAPAGAPVEAR